MYQADIARACLDEIAHSSLAAQTDIERSDACEWRGRPCNMDASRKGRVEFSWHMFVAVATPVALPSEQTVPVLNEKWDNLQCQR